MKLKKVLPIIAILFIVLIAGCKKYVDPGVRPEVTSTNPISKGTNIAINTKISATFSLAMDASTFTVEKFSLKAGSTNVPGVAIYTGSVATFTPDANLTPNTVYTATITTGVTDVLGKSIPKDYVWTYTTSGSADLTPPTITLTNPVSNSNSMAVNRAVVITFNEPLDPATVTPFTINLKQGETYISGAVTSTGNTATFTPVSNLEPNKIYTATVNTGVKDMASNAMVNKYTFNFSTGAIADIILPMVFSTDPLWDNAINVPTNKVILLTFSEAMDPLTINNTTLILKQGTNSIPGTVAYSGMTATFTPTSLLEAGTNYTATITKEAKDLAGNALAANVDWNFSTAGGVANMAVVDLGAAGNYVIMAKTAISNISTSDVTGDLALSPAATSYVTGFSLTNATGYATSAQITGKIFAADMAPPTPISLTTAVTNMITAFNDAAGRPTPDFVELGTGNIGGKTLAPGLYKWTTDVTMPSDVTISGNANSVWIFQISGNLSMSNNVKITLMGGAQAKNIFWQVSGQATIGTTAHFEGVILSRTSITLQTGASFKGRALAQTAVILDGNTVILP